MVMDGTSVRDRIPFRRTPLALVVEAPASCLAALGRVILLIIRSNGLAMFVEDWAMEEVRTVARLMLWPIQALIVGVKENRAEKLQKPVQILNVSVARFTRLPHVRITHGVLITTVLRQTKS